MAKKKSQLKRKVKRITFPATLPVEWVVMIVMTVIIYALITFSGIIKYFFNILVAWFIVKVIMDIAKKKYKIKFTILEVF